TAPARGRRPGRCRRPTPRDGWMPRESDTGSPGDLDGIDPEAVERQGVEPDPEAARPGPVGHEHAPVLDDDRGLEKIVLEKTGGREAVVRPAVARIVAACVDI